MAIVRAFFVLCFSAALLSQASPDHIHDRNAHPFPITARPLDVHLRPRQTEAPSNPGLSICGYRNGELARSWKAPEGSTCFLDHTASYFGWCNVLLTKAEDCTDIPRACVDSSTCSDGCGKTSQSDLPTITCTKASSYCYSNLLVTKDQTYTWLGCDLSRAPLIYSPAAGILDSPSSASATPTGSTTSSSESSPTPTVTGSPAQLSSTPTNTDSSPSTTTLQSGATDSSTSAATSSKSTNAGAIAGGVVGGIAVLAIAGLVFFFIRRRSAEANKKEAAELGPPDYQESPTEKYAYHSELPGAVAATELPGHPNEPVELHGDAAPVKKEKYGH
ncbi:hypothetical protein K458DRAFT_393700 [Lentithecium fluviatile CBS 122367]|uniref:Epidermal growth factor receptor-like transmembrane-juxtamembrane segment domain-containing protein n=1 Tax=Lentithecium fluviatile CBS 122367 TaxID=1168545 RepID=A0A6G1INQ0_9PLEO|nr:hypothetical protein K458DRAFT_393700 [Lentithecium fluviatile CBS 122367]